MKSKRVIWANLTIALLATATCSSCTSDSTVSPTGGTEFSGQPTGSVEGRVVSLITGDKITVLSKDVRDIEITPGEGREHIHFIRKNMPGKHSVIPEDVLPLIRAGKVDPQLFDISLLLKNAELRKRSAERIPIIVEYSEDGKTARERAVRSFSLPLPSSYQMYRDLNYAAMETNGDGQVWQMMQATNASGRISAAPGRTCQWN